MAYEIKNNEDYKQVEVLGLLPTARDPSQWLRMVARVFAAYKGVDVTQSIVAYIDGFQTSIEEDGNDYKFYIKKGGCFIDDQFIGFKDDIIIKEPKINYLPGKRYFLVLQYQWAMEFNYNMAHFKTIEESLFDPGTMLKIQAFEITSAGELNILPSDLDDQFADNFKKIFTLAADKVMDSVESLKFHYIDFTPDNTKVDSSCKSGDFVFLDYVSGKYFPARSCTKRMDKGVGIYLKDNTNNYDYVIYSGIVDFSDPRWIIDPSREYLKILEPGSSYYLADNCTQTNVYDPTTNQPEIDRGKISTKFYPGLVRVGYALTETSMFIQLDFTSDMNMQNLLELFGDKDKFDIRYKDFYEYYELVTRFRDSVTVGDNLNNLITNITNSINDLDTNIHNQLSISNTSKSNYNTSKNSLLNIYSGLDYKTQYTGITNEYTKTFINTLKTYMLDNNSFDYIFDNFDNISKIVKNYIDNIQSIWNSLKAANSHISVTDIGTDINNSITYLNNYYNDLIYLKQLFSDSSYASSALTNGERKIKVILDDYFNHNDTKTNTLTSIENYIKYDDTNSIYGYLYTKLLSILNTTNSLYDQIKDYYSDQMNKDNIRDDEFSINQIKITINEWYNPDKYLPLSDIHDSSATSYKWTETEFENEKLLFEYSNNITITNYAYPTDPIYINIYDNKSTSDKTEILYNATKTIYGQILQSIDTVNKTIENILKGYELLNGYYSMINIYDSYRSDINVSRFKTNIDNNLNTWENALIDFSDKKRTADLDKLKLENLKSLKNYLNDYLNELNTLNSANVSNMAEIQTEINQKQAALGEDLDENNPIKSIFEISNYQRIIYNYTYITQRLKIKYFERKIIDDRIEIIDQKLIEVTSQVIVDQGIVTDLQNLRASYSALQEQINFEIKTLTEEYNKIRTTYLGLEPISDDNPDFDDGGYAVSNLDCLETAE